MKHNFDKIADRRNTDSYKWDIKDGELPMWVADMDFETAPEVKEVVIQRAQIGAFGYSKIPEEFFASIISWWERRHHIRFERDWMVYTSGIVAAISSIVRRITNEGDFVIVQPPVYNIFYNSILNNKRQVLENRLIRKDAGFAMDFADLEEKMSNPKTTLMILCNPHNPSGMVWTKEDLARVGQLAEKYHVKVVSDEIHCDVMDPGYEYTPFLSAGENHKNFSIACLSSGKIFNLAGLQSACIVIPNDELRKFVDRGFNNDEVAEPNFFSMQANIIAFTKGEEWVNQLNEYIANNKKIFYSFIENELPHLKIVNGPATYLVFVDHSYYSDNSEEFCNELRGKTGLWVAAGNKYGSGGERYFRINLATSKENVLDACQRLKSYLASLGR
ncbi:MAG: PatB family C-S lyase [Bacilli bacterium]|nr:PatB family C-S lyase [Bacilli bacterium]